MKDQFQGIENLVLVKTRVWEDRLGIAHWTLEHAFLDSFDNEAEGGDDFKTTALTEARWQYLTAKIKWFLPSAVRHSDTELEKILVHELVHVLLAPEQTLVFERAIDEAEGMTDADSDKLMLRYSEQLELSTEMTTRALWKAYES